MNFSRISPSHGLQFLTNCSSMGPSQGLHSFRYRLLWCGSPIGSPVLPASPLVCGFLSPWVHMPSQEPVPGWASHGVTVSAGHIRDLGSSMGYRSTAWLTMVFPTACRGSAHLQHLDPLLLLLLHSPWCLQSCCFHIFSILCYLVAICFCLSFLTMMFQRCYHCHWWA